MTRRATNGDFERSMPDRSATRMRMALKTTCGGAMLCILAAIGAGLHDRHVPLPGPVIGLSILAASLIGLQLRSRRSAKAVIDVLTPATRPSLKHMGLLFVPAGVGIITQGDLIRASWLPVLVGLFGSTLIGLAATGLALRAGTPAASAPSRKEDRV
jgi:putative effector of murein hydrolase LrgA (UPF0299 family)